MRPSPFQTRYPRIVCFPEPSYSGLVFFREHCFANCLASVSVGKVLVRLADVGALRFGISTETNHTLRLAMRFEPSWVGRTRTYRKCEPEKWPRQLGRSRGQWELSSPRAGEAVRAPAWSGNVVPIAPFCLRKGSSLSGCADQKP